MSSRPARPLVPSLLDLHPPLRHRARRTAIEIHRLVSALTTSFPDSAILAREPHAAEWMDTTPYDHIAADLIVVARALSDTLAALDHTL
jgi:hypothetical protein